MSDATAICSFTSYEPWTNTCCWSWTKMDMTALSFLFIWALKCEVVAHSCHFQSRWPVLVRNGNVHMQYFCTIHTCLKKCHRRCHKECLVGLQEGGVKADQYRIMLFWFLAQCYGLIMGVLEFRRNILPPCSESNPCLWRQYVLVNLWYSSVMTPL